MSALSARPGWLHTVEKIVGTTVERTLALLVLLEVLILLVGIVARYVFHRPIVQADEVAAIFEAPLDFLLDPSNHRSNTVDWNGQARTYFEMIWDGRRIWGATAAMIVNLSKRLA